jgi:hypothetical protein
VRKRSRAAVPVDRVLAVAGGGRTTAGRVTLDAQALATVSSEILLGRCPAFACIATDLRLGVGRANNQMFLERSLM